MIAPSKIDATVGGVALEIARLVPATPCVEVPSTQV